MFDTFSPELKEKLETIATGKVIVEVEYREGVNTKPLRITTPIVVVHYADGTVLSYHTFDPEYFAIQKLIDVIQ